MLKVIHSSCVLPKDRVGGKCVLKLLLGTSTISKISTSNR